MEYEIYHHGTKGMKWGIRRYQNKDGSLTNAGRKRYAKLEAEMKQLKPKKTSKAEKAAEVEKAARKKLVSEMTDDELRERTNRMRMEKEYYDAARNLAVSNPQKVSAGKKFVTSLVNEVIAPAAKTAGREWAEKFMKDKLGLNKKDVVDPIAKLEKQAKKLKAEKEIAEYEADIKKLKRQKKDNDDSLPEVKTWDDVEKKRKYLEAINNPNSQNNQNNNSGNNNSGNNNSGNNNSGNKQNNNSGNNQNNNPKPQQQTTSNGEKTSTNRSTTVHDYVIRNDVQSRTNPRNAARLNQDDYDFSPNKPKQNKAVTATDDDYERVVDQLLAEIDNDGWELYKKYYR